MLDRNSLCKKNEKIYIFVNYVKKSVYSISIYFN